MKSSQKSSKFKSVFIFCIIIFSTLNSTAQDASTKEIKPLEKTIVLKFMNYSVNMDSNIQKQLNHANEYTISYACIPAGLIVVKSNTNFDSIQIEKLDRKLKLVSGISTYKILEGFNISDAEKECTSFRNSK